MGGIKYLQLALEAFAAPVALGIYLDIVGPESAICVLNNPRNDARQFPVHARFFDHACVLVGCLGKRQYVAAHNCINQEGKF